MEELEKEIEVCLGVGMDQIFPTFTKITIPINFDPENAWKQVDTESNESNKK
jgi:hypothetical protein